MAVEGQRRLTVRIPEHIAVRLEAAAAADSRSMNGYLSVLLDRALPLVQEQAAFEFEDAQAS